MAGSKRVLTEEQREQVLLAVQIEAVVNEVCTLCPAEGCDRRRDDYCGDDAVVDGFLKWEERRGMPAQLGQAAPKAAPQQAQPVMVVPQGWERVSH